MSDKPVSTGAEIVKELRALHKWCSPQYGDPMKKAADLIERQEARITKLQDVCAELLEYVESAYLTSEGVDYSNGAIDRARKLMETK